MDETETQQAIGEAFTVSADGPTGYERSTPLYCLCRSGARLVGTLFQELKSYNVSNVPLEGGVLLLANHQSFVDPAFIAAKLPRVLSFLARSGLFEIPVFGYVIRQLNAFPVRQGKGDVGAMKQSIALLQAGKALLVFPEGQRTPDGKLQEIAAGAALIVKRAKVPVVPVAIEGAFNVWPRHRKLPRTGKVRINFGRPIIIHDNDAREIVRIVQAEISRLLDELHEIEEAEREEGILTGPI